MRQTLVINDAVYVQGEDGLWYRMFVTPAAGGAYTSFGEPQTLDAILGAVSGVFVGMLSGVISDVTDTACPQADDRLSVDELTVTDVKGAILLKRLEEGEEGEEG